MLYWKTKMSEEACQELMRSRGLKVCTINVPELPWYKKLFNNRKIEKYNYLAYFKKLTLTFYVEGDTAYILNIERIGYD